MWAANNNISDISIQSCAGKTWQLMTIGTELRLRTTAQQFLRKRIL